MRLALNERDAVTKEEVAACCAKMMRMERAVGVCAVWLKWVTATQLQLEHEHPGQSHSVPQKLLRCCAVFRKLRGIESQTGVLDHITTASASRQVLPRPSAAAARRKL